MALDQLYATVPELPSSTSATSPVPPIVPDTSTIGCGIAMIGPLAVPSTLSTNGVFVPLKSKVNCAALVPPRAGL